MSSSSRKSGEAAFQNEMIKDLLAGGWQLGDPAKYDRARALYTEDALGFVQESQPETWQKFEALYPRGPEQAFLDRLAAQLDKVDPNAATKELRSFGTLGVLRHGLKDRGCRFSLCQFKPEHDLNPETLARFKQNRCRVVPELVYSPWATDEHEAETGVRAKRWRIDLVLFVNGLPVVTLELKSEFKQAVQNAITQYKTTRLAVDPVTQKQEPLLTFKRGALVHFAVSQWEVYMATKLAGDDTFFLPFNKGTADGGAGNDAQADESRHPTDYLWRDVLAPSNLLEILARFIHLEVKEKEEFDGRKVKKETLIFPRYHQWAVVKRLVSAAVTEGPGQKYLVQHSAGSGKSNSIAWTAHQLSSLFEAGGEKSFHSVIIVTDRTVLDDQLQDTIYQLEHVDGVVGRINRNEGEGSKSEKLAAALEAAQPIIIVTIQTFPFVIKAIENSAALKARRFAIVADEAHSSQTGSTARQLREVLTGGEKPVPGEDGELRADDMLDAIVAARRDSGNLSYFAFTATPKPKTLELFGRLPDPALAPSKDNKPAAFHVYSMRQAIEENFILDVLKNYTSYKVAYQLAQAAEASDREVDSKKAKVRLNQWVKLHDYNIAQKVQVVVEHFKGNVAGLLGGQAKAMVVTGSRKEAVRYKLAFDRYVAEHGKTDRAYTKLAAMVAFSGEVAFDAKDPGVEALLDESFSETGMNPGLKGRDMRKAFDSDDYQVMIVANKFQTGFDQPKLCAMYVDKKLGGVECVQTLSRLNRTYPGKLDTGTFVLDFFNEPEEVLASFQPYYQVAELADVSDPNLIYDLFEKLRSGGIFHGHEVERFAEVFYLKNASSAALGNVCKPAVERWSKRYSSAVDAYKSALDMFERTKKTGDAVLVANAENTLKDCRLEKDKLELFKKDLGTYVRYYEFLSQIVDYDDRELEKLSLYARHLSPLLRETRVEEDEIDLSNVMLKHYRLSKIRQQDLQLKEDAEEYLSTGEGAGSGQPTDPQEEFLSQIIQRINEAIGEGDWTDKDAINWMYSIADKVEEGKSTIDQIRNNSREQALLGDFASAFDDAILSSDEARQALMLGVLSDSAKNAKAREIVFDILWKRLRG